MDNIDLAVQRLHTSGVALINIGWIIDAFDVESFLDEQVEFINPSATRQKVLGAFGAYGNPSSFHHPGIRNFRHNSWNYLIQFFERAFPNHWIQCLADRFSTRLDEEMLNAESWHRDCSYVYTPQTTALFGGWANLDRDRSQFFSCVIKSHMVTPPPSTGFVAFTTAESANFKNSPNYRLIEIPPGYAIIFNEFLIHEVLQKNAIAIRKGPETARNSHQLDPGRLREWNYATSHRMYQKFAISTTPQHIFGPELFQMLRRQAPLPLSIDKFGILEIPPMYSANHATSLIKYGKIDELTSTIKPQFYNGTFRLNEFLRDAHLNGKEHNQKRTAERCAVAHPEWVQKLLPSLQLTQMKFPEYTEIEVAMFRPIHMRAYNADNTLF